MAASQIAVWIAFTAVLVPAFAILTACFNAVSPFHFPQGLAFILCVLFVAYMAVLEDRTPFCARKCVHQERRPSGPVSKCVHQELIQTKKYIDSLEDLLQSYGTLIENTGAVCLQALREIYKEQKDHLRQYNSFREQYSSQFGFVVNILEGHRRDIAEASQAAKGNNISLCNIIGQYRQTIEETQGVVRQYMSSTTTALDKHDQAIAGSRELVNTCCQSIEGTLHSHTQLIEHNKKLIQDHGTSLDNVVTNHAELVAEYRAALDGVTLSIAANHIFSLIDQPCGWETLGQSTEEVLDNGPVEDARDGLAQEREKLIKAPGSEAARASMIENVHDLSRTFRKQSNAIIKAGHGKIERTAQGASPSSQGNDLTAGRLYPASEQGSGADQVMATMFSQIQDTVQATVKAQQNEEMQQFRKAQADIEELRAEFAKIQEVRQVIREGHEVKEEHKRMMDARDICKSDTQKLELDETMLEQAKKLAQEIAREETERMTREFVEKLVREATEKVLREVEEKERAERDTTTVSTATTST